MENVVAGSELNKATLGVLRGSSATQVFPFQDLAPERLQRARSSLDPAGATRVGRLWARKVLLGICVTRNGDWSNRYGG